MTWRAVATHPSFDKDSVYNTDIRPALDAWLKAGLTGTWPKGTEVKVYENQEKLKEVYTITIVKDETDPENVKDVKKFDKETITQ